MWLMSFQLLPVFFIKSSAVLRLRGSICHLRGFSFTNARKIYCNLRFSNARFLITFTGNLDILFIIVPHYQNKRRDNVIQL